MYIHIAVSHVCILSYIPCTYICTYVFIATCNLACLYVYMQHYGIFKREHRESVGKQVCTCKFTVPEIKIIFVLLFWLFSSTLTWTSLNIRDGRTDAFINILQRYIGCMAGGNREGHDCHMLRLDLEAKSIPVLEGVYLIANAFLSFASLPFVIQFQTMKKFVIQAAKKLNFNAKTNTTYTS